MVFVYSRIVPDFTISAYGRFVLLFSRLCFLLLFIGIPKAETGCQEIDRERKEDRVRPKKRELHGLPYTEIHGLPYTEIVQSGTILLLTRLWP